MVIFEITICKVKGISKIKYYFMICVEMNCFNKVLKKKSKASLVSSKFIEYE
jgi:hypothetical protein